MVDELLDAIADRSEIEVVDALAAQYPSRLTCDLLGFPPERWRDPQVVVRADDADRLVCPATGAARCSKT